MSTLEFHKKMTLFGKLPIHFGELGVLLDHVLLLLMNLLLLTHLLESILHDFTPR